MAFFRIILIFGFLFVGSHSLIAQNTDVKASENERLFTDKDKDFMQLWYYDQVLKMQLNEQGRSDYLALLTYYTFKMTRLGLAKYGNTEAEQKTKFDSLVVRLNEEMQDLLSTKNYQIHVESFVKIEEAVYKKKNWKK